jgi:hypothetical protein
MTASGTMASGAKGAEAGAKEEQAAGAGECTCRLTGSSIVFVHVSCRLGTCGPTLVGGSVFSTFNCWDVFVVGS